MHCVGIPADSLLLLIFGTSPRAPLFFVFPLAVSPPPPPPSPFCVVSFFVLIATADSCGLPGLEKERVSVSLAARQLCRAVSSCCLVLVLVGLLLLLVRPIPCVLVTLLRMCPIERHLGSRRLFAACRTTTKKKKCSAAAAAICRITGRPISRDLLGGSCSSSSATKKKKKPFGKSGRIRGSTGAVSRIETDSTIQKILGQASRRRVGKTTRTTAITAATTSVNHPNRNLFVVPDSSYYFCLPSTFARAVVGRHIFSIIDIIPPISASLVSCLYYPSIHPPV